MDFQTAETVIEQLSLLAHPEGGYFCEVMRHQVGDSRGYGTAIYYLLRTGQTSHWHRIDGTEVFHYYAGLPLEIRLWSESAGEERHVLGPDLRAGQRPLLVVPPHTWQTARPSANSLTAADYSLVGCTVTPAFEFSGFELAPAGWEPPRG